MFLHDCKKNCTAEQARARKLLQNSLVACLMSHTGQMGWSLPQERTQGDVNFRNYWILFEAQPSVIFCH